MLSIVWLATMLLLLPAAAPAPAAVRQAESPCGDAIVCLGEGSFDWTDVDEQDRAHFHWNAEVINEGPRRLQVRVTVELLDADEQVVASDGTTAAVEARARARLEHDGVLPYERAAEVVSFRFRVEPQPRAGVGAAPRGRPR